MARFDNAAAIDPIEAARTPTTAQHYMFNQHDGSPADFEARLEAMGGPSVLAVVFTRDMTVNAGTQ